MRACVRACVCASVRASVRAHWVGGWVGGHGWVGNKGAHAARGRVCARACTRACTRAYARARARVHVGSSHLFPVVEADDVAARVGSFRDNLLLLAAWMPWSAQGLVCGAVGAPWSVQGLDGGPNAARSLVRGTRRSPTGRENRGFYPPHGNVSLRWRDFSFPSTPDGSAWVGNSAGAWR